VDKPVVPISLDMARAECQTLKDMVSLIRTSEGKSSTS
jgi:hypothetical protein